MNPRALDFPFGRPFVPAGLLRRRRELPGAARALVQVGERVQAQQPIAEASGDGDAAVLAGLVGTVVEVGRGHVTIEGRAMVVAGILGLGEAAVGPLAVLPGAESPAVAQIARGAIILSPRQLPLTLMQRAAAAGAAGIIAGSASALEFEAFARTDLSVMLDRLTPEDARFPLTVVLTEGLGDQPMQPGVFSLLAQRAGQVAMIEGSTAPRRGVRPEVLLAPADGRAVALPMESGIAAGARVVISAGKYRGAIGEVIHLFGHAQLGETGQMLPMAGVRLEDGAVRLVPVTNLDRVG